MSNSELSNLRLSALRALLGAIPTSLRAYSVEFSGQVIRARSVFDETWIDEHKELLSVVGTEIVSDFHTAFTIEEEFLSVPKSEPMENLAHLIYLRHEARA